MSLFSRVRDGFWNYVSPRKTQERRDKPFKASATRSRLPSKKAEDHTATLSPRRSIGPESPTWPSEVLRANSPEKSPINAPRTPTTFDPERPLQSTELAPGFELEGDTLIEDENLYDGDTILASEDQLSEAFLDIEEERERWIQKAQTQREKGWSEHAIEIFRRIGMRGREVLFPASWKIDFPTLPAELFSQNGDDIFIDAIEGSEFRAIKSLQELLHLGGRIRDARDQEVKGHGPEKAARRGIENYMKWACSDGGINDFDDIPILQFAIGDSNTSSTALENDMIDSMEKTAAGFCDILQVFPEEGHNHADDTSNPDSTALLSDMEYITELPTLYGVIASNTIVALVAYNVAASQPTIETIAVLNYNDVRYEAWNGIAIATFCIHCRNQLLALQPFLQASRDTLNSQADPDI